MVGVVFQAHRSDMMWLYRYVFAVVGIVLLVGCAGDRPPEDVKEFSLDNAEHIVGTIDRICIDQARNDASTLDSVLESKDSVVNNPSIVAIKVREVSGPAETDDKDRNSSTTKVNIVGRSVYLIYGQSSDPLYNYRLGLILDINDRTLLDVRLIDLDVLENAEAC